MQQALAPHRQHLAFIWLLALALTALLFSPASHAAEPIGHLVVAAGKLTAVGVDGQTRRLKRRDPIFAGDTLKTSGNVFAQVRFTDGALIALRPDTEFEIQDYRFNGSEDGSEKVIFNLIKGGFRTITGAIGHKNKQNYQVTTAVATIGIRGTHYGLRLLTAELARQNSDAGRDVQEGLYGGVVDGEIAVGNQAGDTTFGNDRYFHVADANSEAQTLIAPPGVVFDIDRRSGGGGEEEDDHQGNGQQSEQQDQGDGEGEADGGDGNEDAASDGEGSAGDGGDNAQDGNGEGGENGSGDSEQSGQSGERGDSANDDNARGSDDQGGEQGGGEQGNAGSSTDNQSVNSSDSNSPGGPGDSAGQQPAQNNGGPRPGANGNPGAGSSPAPQLATSGGSGVLSANLVNPDSLGFSPVIQNSIEVEPIFEVNETFDPVTSTSSFTRAALNSRLLLSFADIKPGTGLDITVASVTDDGTDAHKVLLNASGQLVNLEDQATDGADSGTLHKFEFGTATLQNSGSGNGFSWGRWNGGYVVTSDGVAENTQSDLHFIYNATPVSLNTLTSNLGGNSNSEPILNFNRLETAGTSPTDSNGNIGSYEYAALSINFATQKILRYDLKVLAGGKTYEVQLSNTPSLSEAFGDSGFDITGHCSGCSSSSLTGQANLSFASSSAAFAASAFGVFDSARTVGVSGALVFEKISTQSPPVTAPSNADAIGAFITSNNGGHQTNLMSDTGDTADNIKLSSINGVGNVLVKATAGDTGFDSGRAELTNTGGNTIGVNWGRWQDGWSAEISGNGVGPNGHAHFIYSDSLTSATDFSQSSLQAITNASFNLVPGSGTSPTDLNGNTGTLNSASMMVNFGTLSINNYKVNVTVAGRTFDMQQQNTASISTSLATSISLADNNSSATGHSSTRFLGNTASHAMSGYSVSDNNTHVVGTLLMQR